MDKRVARIKPPRYVDPTACDTRRQPVATAPPVAGLGPDGAETGSARGLGRPPPPWETAPMGNADIIIRNGTVIDGSGAPARRTNVVVRDDRVAGFSEAIPPDSEVIDATGLVVTPGFIDVHSHSDYTLLVDPRAASSVARSSSST